MQKITFAEEVKPSSLNQAKAETGEEMSNRKMSSGSNDENKWNRRLSSHSSIPENEEAIDDREHRQDWNKTTAEKDTWAWQERRRLSGFYNTDVATHKHIAGRRGSVLSMWAPGKDAQGRDVLSHNDDGDRQRSDDIAVGSPKSGTALDNSLLPGSPRSQRRQSNLSVESQPRRGSILSMWKGGKDANGNDVIGHDDEEWAR